MLGFKNPEVSEFQAITSPQLLDDFIEKQLDNLLDNNALLTCLICNAIYKLFLRYRVHQMSFLLL